MAIISLLTFSSFKNETPGNTNSNTKTTIKGTIIDKCTGECLAGVKVCLDGTNIITYSDFDGNFEFNQINKDKEYSITSTLISYRSNKYIKTEKNKQKNITIKLEHVE